MHNQEEDDQRVADKYGKTTWYKMLRAEMKNQNENWHDVVATTLTEQEKHREFDYARQSEIPSCPFTLWTEKRVYFPTEYDGTAWVASVPRNPCGEATKHI